jgi:hypothetical protein
MANNGSENLTHKYTEKIEPMKPTENGGAWNGKQFLLHLKTEEQMSFLNIKNYWLI